MCSNELAKTAANVQKHRVSFDEAATVCTDPDALDGPDLKRSHEARFLPYQGTGAYGDEYGPDIEYPCWIDETRRLVRATDGSEKVAEATLLLPLDARTACTPGSLVVLHTELEGPHRESQVLTAATIPER